MNLVKKMLISLIILCGIIFAGIMVCCMVMFLSPGEDVLGIGVRYFANNYDKMEGQEINESIPVSETFTTLNIESGFSNIEILYDADLMGVNYKSIYCQCRVSVSGFMTNYDEMKQAIQENGFGKNELLKVRTWATLVKDSSSQSLTIKIIEPQGFYINNASTFIITLPENVFTNVNIKTASGSIVIGSTSDAAPIITQNLRITNKDISSRISIPNVTINDKLIINKDYGRFSFDKDIASSVEINTHSASFEFKNIAGSLLTVNGVNPSLIAKNIAGTLNLESTAGGNLKVDNINGSLSINSPSVTCQVGQLLGSVGVVSDYGTVTINTLGNEEDVNDYGVASFVTGRGSVTVEKSYMIMHIETTQGNVNIKDACNKVTAQTTYGSVNIVFNETYVGKEVNVTTIDGSVTMKNISGKATINSTGYSNMKLQFDTVVNGSSIINNSKQTLVYVPISNFQLTVSVRDLSKLIVDCGSITEEDFSAESTNGNMKTYKYAVNGYSGVDNVLSISCSGTTADAKVTVYDNSQYVA